MTIEIVNKACEFLIRKANYEKDDKGKLVPKSLGRCAEYVRNSWDFAFGKSMPRTNAAKNYGPIYEGLGFEKVFSYPAQEKALYKPEIGDICIIQYEPYGHICVKTKKGWCSDFMQIDMYGGSIRKKNPPIDIYRLI